MAWIDRMKEWYYDRQTWIVTGTNYVLFSTLGAAEYYNSKHDFKYEIEPTGGGLYKIKTVTVTYKKSVDID